MLVTITFALFLRQSKIGIYGRHPIMILLY